MNFQIAKLRGNFVNPWTLRPNTCLTIRTAFMLLLDSIHYEISHGYTLLPQQREISLCLSNTHRFRNRNERKTRLLLVMKQLTHRLDPLAQIPQEDIHFVGDRSAPRKMSDDVAMLVAHQIQRLHHSIKHLRQTQQTGSMT